MKQENRTTKADVNGENAQANESGSDPVSGLMLSQTDSSGAGGRHDETIEQLFCALESPLLQYGIRLLGDRALAEDVVQEAFMKLHTQFDEVRERRAWLYRTVHNLAVNQRRRAGKVVSFDPMDVEKAGDEAVDSQLWPDQQLAHWEAIGLVRLSLAALDGRSRELVRLKFHENLSYKEISQRTGLTVGHVGYLLHHALKSVAAELAKSGEGV